MVKKQKILIAIGVIVGFIDSLAYCNSPQVWPVNRFGVSLPPDTRILHADRSNDFDFYIDGHAEATITFEEKYRKPFISSFPPPGAKCAERHGCSVGTTKDGSTWFGIEPPGGDDSLWITLSAPNVQGIVTAKQWASRD